MAELSEIVPMCMKSLKDMERHNPIVELHALFSDAKIEKNPGDDIYWISRGLLLIAEGNYSAALEDISHLAIKLTEAF